MAIPSLPILASGPTFARIRPGLPAGEPVLPLSPPVAGETRSLHFAGERFALDAFGNVVAGTTPCPAGTFHCILRQSRHGQAIDTAFVVAAAAETPGRRWQGMGQGMRLVESFGGGSARAMLSRSGHHANRPFRRFRVVLPVFIVDGRPLLDTLFDGPRAEMRFQVGLEYPYTQNHEGIPPRFPVTFEGARFAHYRRGGWNEAVGHMLSDPMELPFEIPARAKFGLWTTCELPAGAYRNALPYSRTGSNSLQRFGGARFSDKSLIDGGEAALSASAIPPFNDWATGSGQFFTPAMLLLESESAGDCFVILGDSMAKGVGSGGAGSQELGDVQGDREGNLGVLDRALFHDLQADFVNLARGSDGNKYVYLPDAARYRLALRRLAGPSATINQNGHNDVSQMAVMPQWKAGVEHVPGDSVLAECAGLYVTMSGGSSGSAPPSGQAITGRTGEASWLRISADAGGEKQRMFLQLSRLAAVNAALKRDLPDDPLVGFCVTPDADSADRSWDNTDQTSRSGWGGGGSRRGMWNARIRKRDPWLSLDAVIDVNATLEDGYPTETSRWSFEGGRVTVDGTHLNSYGEERARGPVTQTLDPLKVLRR